LNFYCRRNKPDTAKQFGADRHATCPEKGATPSKQARTLDRSGLETKALPESLGLFAPVTLNIDNAVAHNPNGSISIHGLRYACLRYFNAAGAAGEQGEDHHPESHLIPIALQVALGLRKDVAIFGTDYPTPDGTCIRDYVHVSDLAAAHVLVLEALKEKSQLIYNLGNGRGFSVREVLAAVRKITGHAIPAQESPRRPGDPVVLVASSEKINRELGWKPEHTELETIVRSAWNWRKAHPDGYPLNALND